MKYKPYVRIISIAIIFLSLLYFRRPKPGFFISIPNGIKVDYHIINTENSEVAAYITYKGKTYMRIQYNVLTEETILNGSAESIKLNRFLRSKTQLSDAEYIEMVQSSARYFVATEITNPAEHYEQN